MKCGICNRDMGVEGARFKVCLGCWKDLGEPKSREDLKRALEARPGLVDEILRRSIYQ